MLANIIKPLSVEYSYQKVIDGVPTSYKKDPHKVLTDYRKQLIEAIVTSEYVRSTKSVNKFKMPKTEHAKLVRRITSVVYSPISKVAPDDRELILEWLAFRNERVQDISTVSIGELMLSIANRLEIEYGGSVLFWMDVMTSRIAGPDAFTKFGDYITNTVNYG